MTLVEPELATVDGSERLPPEVELILSALETGRHHSLERRAAARHAYRVIARLRLFTHRPHMEPRTIYTRDVHSRGLGFVTRDRLPLGCGGILDLPHPQNGLMRIACTLYRCRQTAPGWYEGMVCFNRDQPDLSRACLEEI